MRHAVCRTIMHVGRELPVTLVLRQLLQNSFPEEYEQRRKEEQGLSSAAGGEAPLPLFVMSCILPGAGPGCRVHALEASKFKNCR